MRNLPTALFSLSLDCGTGYTAGFSGGRGGGGEKKENTAGGL